MPGMACTVVLYFIQCVKQNITRAGLRLSLFLSVWCCAVILPINYTVCVCVCACVPARARVCVQFACVGEEGEDA